MSHQEQPLRYIPTIPFPAYAFVPGILPHPTQNPEGHSYGLLAEEADPPEIGNWRASRMYLYGIDLFNYGYYWEAHEAWEELWHACGHTGRRAEFLKGLIKLTAAGVEAREGKPHGVQIHAGGALIQFERVASLLREEGSQFMGFSLPELIKHAATIASNPARYVTGSDEVQVVFDFHLLPK